MNKKTNQLFDEFFISSTQRFSSSVIFGALWTRQTRTERFKLFSFVLLLKKRCNLREHYTLWLRYVWIFGKKAECWTTSNQIKILCKNKNEKTFKKHRKTTYEKWKNGKNIVKCKQKILHNYFDNGTKRWKKKFATQNKIRTTIILFCITIHLKNA